MRDSVTESCIHGLLKQSLANAASSKTNSQKLSFGRLFSH